MSLHDGTAVKAGLFGNLSHGSVCVSQQFRSMYRFKMCRICTEALSCCFLKFPGKCRLGKKEHSCILSNGTGISVMLVQFAKDFR